MSGIFHAMWGAVVRAAQTLAGAIDLDGTNDYLSKASDLTGNADGKTFTFSAWVWVSSTSVTYTLYQTDNTNIYFTVYIDNGSVTITGLNSSATTILQAVADSGADSLEKYTWNHVLVSIDLANTSNRSIYVNDIARSVTWTTYTNANIDFTRTQHAIGAQPGGGQAVNGRLAHVYLDYTYRDLSNSTNRRLFITADLKPASGQAALNPILYLPMDDPTTAHVNSGTGGNFTLNGTIARSGRGPNQFNVPYSDLDGVADYLSLTTAPTGISDGTAFTFASTFNLDAATSVLLNFSSGTGSPKLLIRVFTSYLEITARNSAGTTILSATSPVFYVSNRNFHLALSIDLTDTGKRSVYINGSAVSMTWTTYTNDNIDFNIATNPRCYVGRDNDGTFYFNGRLGNVFFHTSYIDLSNAANLAKFVTGTGIDAKPVDPGADGSTPLGVQPLIYLPMYGNNAGKNYGSGGDFTVNSGPYTGARGPNEFWGNKADFDGSTGYLNKASALTGVSNGKTFSYSFWMNPDGVASAQIHFAASDNSNNLFFGVYQINQTIKVIGRNSAGTDVLDGVTGNVLSAGSPYYVQIYVDLTDTGKRGIYINGSSTSVTWATYTNDNIAFASATKLRIGQHPNGTLFVDGKLSEFYFTTEYIDFSQEANRLKFRDAFGNPVDLGADGSTPTGTAPAIYMRFDPAAQGTNSGTGGAFIKSGTISDGGQL